MQEDEIQATRDRWLRLDSWTPPQAFMLICKADPDSEGYPLKPLPCFESEFDPSEAFATYEELERIWYSGSHGNGDQNPSYFIDWATQKGLDVSWLGSDESALDTPDADTGSAVLRGSRPEQSSDEEPVIRTKARNSYLRVIATLCAELKIDLYSRDAVKQIEDMTEKADYHVGPDTVRKIINEIKEV